MKQIHYLTTTVQKGNRLDITLPSLPVGQTIEVILIVPETAPSSQPIDRPAFRQLPIEERRRILTQQAEAMKDYYQKDQEWKDWLNFDNSEVYDYQS